MRCSRRCSATLTCSSSSRPSGSSPMPRACLALRAGCKFLGPVRCQRRLSGTAACVPAGTQKRAVEPHQPAGHRLTHVTLAAYRGLVFVAGECLLKPLAAAQTAPNLLRQLPIAWPHGRVGFKHWHAAPPKSPGPRSASERFRCAGGAATSRPRGGPSPSIAPARWSSWVRSRPRSAGRRNP